ncbi:MAG: D-xylose ABC transporter substrate-binding protein [Pseudodesulfovibrio sp.]|jgi:D-xylose transport system substrate-binding protein|uniref:Sugar ABC transporter substrate-binding protein n=1 Tax=Pseudodesulfovibrio indicus TaxID=1716143 RepID=A0A126QRS1_9BACT|nr:D-xylose ABC transporter substrate-binding protein [Pseudodesulfovibrio indicus]AMK12612.1 sugar ABC transporter substrate-binding protein [Pseudodesulfovibrio indicus]TDT90923.1 xylose-binding protein [Pseudodesulfovibrio indicus]
MLKKLALLAVAAVAVLAFGVNAMAKDLVVGVSWSNFQEERWKTDEAAIKDQLKAMGAKYIMADAQASAEKQIADIENLIARGANALIVLAWDADAVLPAIDKAMAEGLPVVGYDRLIEKKGVFYLTFDNKEVGRMQARAVYAVKPEGNYVFIKGAPTDPNAEFLYEGQLEVLDEAIKAGKIKNVAAQGTEGWKPEVAQRNMEQILTAMNNKVDAVVASNDGTAGGVVAALTAQGMEGVTPVSGQDGDHAALNRVARGLQTVSVWKDARVLGQAAARIAVELSRGELPKDTVKWSGGAKGVEMDAILLPPVPVTKANLSLVVDAGWISKDVLCQGVQGQCP